MTARKIVKSDLLKLLPDYEEATLPKELISQTETFLSQITTDQLTAAEQPARSFVCAHIACEQLANRFELPDLNTSKIPIVPSKYKALFKRLRNDAVFKQVQDSGKSRAESSRKVARDIAKEVCSKLDAVPLSTVLLILDRILPHYKAADLRALVAATWLVSHQHMSQSNKIVASNLTALVKELGIAKTEIEEQITFVRANTTDEDWAQLHVSKLKYTAETKKEKVARIRMVAHGTDYTSARAEKEYQAWERDILVKLESRLTELRGS